METRIIPALAGNTDLLMPASKALTDHPRSRGEYEEVYDYKVSDYGSSPLSRGIRAERLQRLESPGIIPALAGNTSSLERWAATRRDHPRSRGEYYLITPGPKPPKGSSPLSRGIPANGLHDNILSRIIPALAGNTKIANPDHMSGKDHPRSRGEYPLTSDEHDEFLGSSPLSRGIPLTGGLHR